MAIRGEILLPYPRGVEMGAKGMKGLRTFSWVFCFIFLSSWLQARTPGRAIDEKAIQETLHISLDGQWKLYYFPQGERQIRHPDQLKTQGLTAIDATVPGEAVLDLSRKGVLPADLLYGENITKLKPYELYEWWYQREFPTPVGITGQRVELLFHEVDCLANYWLNGKPLGETANALIEHHFDVTGKLNSAGPNILTIRLRSPVIEADSKEYDPAYRIYSGRTNQEAAWIRRAPHSFGMDIMPRAISAGLWRPVELFVHSRHEITNMYFATTAIEPGRARLAVAFELATDLTLLPRLQLKVEGHCGESTFSYTHKVEFSKGWYEFDLQNPRL
jgi:beta-mannosidase